MSDSATHAVDSHAAPLSAKTERRIRLAALGSAILISLCAVILSYSGLHDLAVDAGIERELALLVPIMFDGLQFVGSMGVVYSTLSGLKTRYPWFLLLLGVAVSAWGNWQAAPDDVTAKILHAASPIILALVLEELLRVMRSRVQAHERALRAAADATSSEVDLAVDTRSQPRREHAGDVSTSETGSRSAATPPAPAAAPTASPAAVHHPVTGPPSAPSVEPTEPALPRAPSRPAVSTDVDTVLARARATASQPSPARQNDPKVAPEEPAEDASADAANSVTAPSTADARAAAGGSQVPPIKAADVPAVTEPGVSTGPDSPEPEAAPVNLASAGLVDQADPAGVPADRQTQADYDPFRANGQNAQAVVRPTGSVYEQSVDAFATPDVVEPVNKTSPSADTRPSSPTEPRTDKRSPGQLDAGTPDDAESSEGSDSSSDGTSDSASKKDMIRDLLAANPRITGAEIARQIGADRSYTYQVIREVKAEGTPVGV